MDRSLIDDFEDFHLHTLVFLPTSLGVVGGDGFGFTIASVLEPRFGDATLLEKINDGLRALPRKFVGENMAAPTIGMPNIPNVIAPAIDRRIESQVA